jgi:rhodanese-related sulfurtransferase
MKSVLLMACLAFVSVSSAQRPPAEQGTKEPAFKAHVLSVTELDQALAAPGKVLLIDVRRPDEVSSIGGFPVYLSIQSDQLAQSLAWIPRDRSVITVSNHAARAGKAADLLAGKGFKVLGAVGTQTYEQAGGKLVTHIAVPPPKTAAER